MPQQSKKLYIYVLLVLVLLIIFHYLGITRFIENVARFILIPISTKIYETGNKIKGNFKFLNLNSETKEKYENCIKFEENFNVLEVKTRLLEEENTELKKILNFKEETKYKLLPTKIIGKSIDSIEQNLIIGQGSKSGIKIGQPVIVGNGILIGKISKIENDTAQIRLINDNQSRIASTILNKNKSLGVVEGGFGISLRMKYIPRNEIVLIDEQIITSGLEINMPYGLLIGTVAVVENEAYKPFQQAVLNPATDLSHLILVAVLID